VTALLQAPVGRDLPPGIQTWLEDRGMPIVRVADADDLVATCLRGRPRLILLDGRGKAEDIVVPLLERIKSDAYTGVIPSVVFTDPRPACIERAFAAGADEVLSDSFTEAEARIRLDVVLRRSDRDVMVHPSTRLPGAVEIDA
jgi:CheY-like chemotaxis protein